MAQPPDPKLKREVQWGAMGPGAKAPGLKLKNKMASIAPNSKTRRRLVATVRTGI